MTTPAGWYDDPGAPGSGRLRWWDGAAWTDHVRPAPQEQPAGQQQPVGPQATQQQPVGQQQYQPYPQQYPAAAPYQAQQYQGQQYQAKPTHTPDGAPLASVWLRLAARLIDFVILGVLQTLLSLPFLPRLFDSIVTFIEETNDAVMAGATPPDPFALYTDPDFYQPYLAIGLISFVLGVVYFVGFHRLRGATPGKMMLGLRVRHWERPGNPGWGPSFLRYGLEIVGSLFCSGVLNIVDALWCLWDPRRQTLHDKVAKTVVVSTR